MKVVVFAVLLSVLAFLGLAVEIGWRMAREERTPRLLKRHRTYSTYALWAVMIALILLEAMVHVPAFEAHPAYPLLLYGHLFFAAIFFCSFLVLKFWLTGEKKSAVHRRIVYLVTMPSFCIALPTGLVMLYQM